MVRFHLGVPKIMSAKPSKNFPKHSVDISEETGVRYLHFGSDWVQGAMRIARPWSLELAYTREMMAGLLLRPVSAWPRSALLVGLGAGSLAKFIYRNLPDCRITVVEINPQVEFIARQYFKLPDDPRRLDVVIRCGADYMLSGDRQFDLVLHLPLRWEDETRLTPIRDLPPGARYAAVLPSLPGPAQRARAVRGQPARP